MSKDLYSSVQCPGGQQPAASSLVRVENIQLIIIAIILRCGRALHDCLQEEEARGEQGAGAGGVLLEMWSVSSGAQQGEAVRLVS